MIVGIRDIEFEPLLKLNGQMVTKEDLHHLYISGPEKLSVLAISFILGVKPRIVCLHMDLHNISGRVADGSYFLEAHEWQRNEVRKRNRSLAESKVAMKKPDIEKVKIDGNTYSDNSMIEGYENHVQAAWRELRFGHQKELNKVRNVDLSAMRLHRGMDMFQFSSKADLKYKHVLYFEKTPDVVIPKEISDTYMRVLKISNAELKRIRQVLAGKRSSMFNEGERPIPESVKRYVFERDGGKCTNCEETRFLHFHHKQRFSDGGKHQARNLKILCIGCHALEHYGEPGYGLLKGKAEKLGIIVGHSLPRGNPA